jgi:hypothetical protein
MSFEPRHGVFFGDGAVFQWSLVLVVPVFLGIFGAINAWYWMNGTAVGLVGMYAMYAVFVFGSCFVVWFFLTPILFLGGKKILRALY